MQGTTSIRISNKLHRALRAKAKLDGRTVTYLINAAVEKWLEGQRQPEPTQQKEE